MTAEVARAEAQAVETAAHAIEDMLRAVQTRSWRSVITYCAYVSRVAAYASVLAERRSPTPIVYRPEEP